MEEKEISFKFVSTEKVGKFCRDGYPFHTWDIMDNVAGKIIPGYQIHMYPDVPGLYIMVDEIDREYGPFITVMELSQFVKHGIFDEIPPEKKLPEQQVDFLFQSQDRVMYRVRWWQEKLQLFYFDTVPALWKPVRDVNYNELRYLPKPLPETMVYPFKRRIFPN